MVVKMGIEKKKGIEKNTLIEDVEKGKINPFDAANLIKLSYSEEESTKLIKEIIKICIEKKYLILADDVASLLKKDDRELAREQINDEYRKDVVIQCLKDGLENEKAIEFAEYVIGNISKDKEKKEMQKLENNTKRIRAYIERKNYEYAESEAKEITNKGLRIKALEEIAKGYIKNDKPDSAIDIVKNSLPKDEEGERAIEEIAEELLKKGPVYFSYTQEVLKFISPERRDQVIESIIEKFSKKEKFDDARKIVNKFISSEDKKVQLFEKITEYEKKKEELGNKLRG